MSTEPPSILFKIDIYPADVAGLSLVRLTLPNGEPPYVKEHYLNDIEVKTLERWCRKWMVEGANVS